MPDLPFADLSAFAYKCDEPSEPPNKKRKQEAPKTARPPATGWSGPLPPILEPGLTVVFVGFNPGMESARVGHYYAHPSNRFWKFLFWSGIATKLHTPFEDRSMPDLYKVGFTDLVARATKGITQLNRAELAQGATDLEQRIARVAPQAVCLVGKGIWEAVAKGKRWDLKQFRYGEDTHVFGGARLFCVPSTSGLNSIAQAKQLEAWEEVAQVGKLGEGKSSEESGEKSSEEPDEEPEEEPDEEPEEEKPEEEPSEEGKEGNSPSR